MPPEVLSNGPTEGSAGEWRWTVRLTRAGRALAATAGVTALLGVTAVRAPADDERAGSVATVARTTQRRMPDPATRDARAVVDPGGTVVVAPVSRPSVAAARRSAELVMRQQCTYIDRPRVRADESGAADGTVARFVVTRSLETARKSAGFDLVLRWQNGSYVGAVTAAYGACRPR